MPCWTTIRGRGPGNSSSSAGSHQPPNSTVSKSELFLVAFVSFQIFPPNTQPQEDTPWMLSSWQTCQHCQRKLVEKVRQFRSQCWSSKTGSILPARSPQNQVMQTWSKISIIKKDQPLNMVANINEQIPCWHICLILWVHWERWNFEIFNAIS